MIEWRPIAGVDFERAEVAQEATFCSDARNFLFERGVARTRPHARGVLAASSSFNTGAKTDFSKTFEAEDRSYYYLYIQDDGKVYRNSANEVTGSGTSFGSRQYHNMTAVNGNVIVGNNVGGGLHWTPPTGGTYTLLTNAKYRYFTSNRSRAFAAYDITSGSNDPRKVAWSATGDETDWTGTTAGTATLAEAPDGITGLKTVSNVVVILRDTGISLAYPTGSSTSGTFRFENAVLDGVGCPFPSTVSQYNNTVFFLGPDDVYAYNVTGAPQPIGRQVRDMIHREMALGAEFRSFVTRGDRLIEPGRDTGSVSDLFYPSVRPRARLHFVATANNFNHYCYDIESQTWTVHSYSRPIRFGYPGRFAAISGVHPVHGLGLLTDADPSDTLLWYDGVSGPTNDGDTLDYTSEAGSITSFIDADHFIESPTFVIGDGTQDFEVKRVLVSWKCDAPIIDPPPVEVTVQCKQQYNSVGASTQRALVELDDSMTWQRTFFDMRVNGNYFKVKVTVPQRLKLSIDRIVLLGDHSNEARTSDRA